MYAVRISQQLQLQLTAGVTVVILKVHVHLIFHICHIPAGDNGDMDQAVKPKGDTFKVFHTHCMVGLSAAKCVNGEALIECFFYCPLLHVLAFEVYLLRPSRGHES